MKARLLTAAFLLGAAAGAAAAGRWIVVASSVSDVRGAASALFLHNAAIGAALTTVIAVAGLALAVSTLKEYWATAVPALVGALIYVGLAALAVASKAAGISPLLLALAALTLGLLAAYLLRRSSPWLPALMVAAVFAPGAAGIGLVSGDALALRALSWAPPPGVGYYLTAAASCALLAVFIGFAVSHRANKPSAARVVHWLTIGAAAGIAISLLQTVLYVFWLQSGFAANSFLIAAIVVFALSASAAVMFAVRPRSLIRAAAPAGLAVLLVLYVGLGLSGWREFSALGSLHLDRGSVYLHFTSDGGWHRTQDSAASSPKASRATEFVARYPYSAYRPAAMLTAAEALMDLWRFDEASAMLRAMRADYPSLDGYARVLHALSDLSRGRPETLLQPADEQSAFARWRSTRGAQLAALAAERAGMPVIARGLHSAYLDHLLDIQSAAWTPDSLEFTRDAMDRLSRRLETGPTVLPTGRVKVSVKADGKPVRGARVVLVQPRFDPALPSDSRHFTGARTVSAWGGLWSVTDRNGRAIITDVPFGTYEVVLGLDFDTAPGCVASSPIAPVIVARPSVDGGIIALSPALRLIRPAPGAVVTSPAFLEWQPYPGAGSYAVSIVELAGPGDSTGVTCWAKSGIRETSATVTSDGFLNGRAALQSGRLYMWLVRASDASGRTLSSSEHYFDTSEPVFRVSHPITPKASLAPKHL